MQGEDHVNMESEIGGCFYKPRDIEDASKPLERGRR